MGTFKIWCSRISAITERKGGSLVIRQQKFIHTSSTCIICGKTINGKNKTLEHIFPKVTMDYCLNNQRYVHMRNFINSIHNKGISCTRCNSKKGAYILSIEDIKSLHIPDSQKNILITNRKVYAKEFEAFQQTEYYNSKSWFLGNIQKTYPIKDA